MRLSIATFAFALAATASAQLSLGNLTSLVSAPCLGAVMTLFTSNSTACLNLPALLPLVTMPNSSIVPVLDSWMAGLCPMPACSNATITNLTNTVLTGCATDLAKYNVTNSTVRAVVAQYPLVRDVVCLKTTAPVNFTNASIPLTSPPYNLTNGTFCITSQLTELSAFLGNNLTLSYLYNTVSAVLGGNASTALLSNLSRIPSAAVCSDCSFAQADLIFERYPSLLNATIQLGNSTMGNMTTPAGNITVARFINATCPASNYTVNSNGSLPNTTFESAFNSTGNTTMLYRRIFDTSAIRRRWMWQL